MEEWLQASLSVPREVAAQAEQLMESQGALSVTLTDTGDQPILEPGVGETPLWDEVRVTGLFPAGTQEHLLAAVLSLAPGVHSPRQVTTKEIAGKDWVSAWQDDLESVRFGKGLWIVPAGKPVPAGAETVLRMDPGLAFGSGAHPTTWLCLEWLESCGLEGLDVIDFGCGSGVLGIAAALLGARRVVCVDNDPQALTATRANARRNGVAERIEVSHAGHAALPRADLVVANILAGTLVLLAPRLCDALRGGGRMALSGILEHQAEAVAAAYAPRVGDLQVTLFDGWVLMASGGAARD